MDKALIILSGVPGCGKSTFARLFHNGETCVHIQTDEFWINPDTGQYEFKGSRLKEAHYYAARLCIEQMQKGVPMIMVEDANTKETYLERFQTIADCYGYKTVYIVLENRHGGKDIHNVAEDTLLRMERELKARLKLR